MTMLMVFAVSCMIMPVNAKAAKKAYIKTTTGNKTTFTFNPNWKSVTIYFTSENGKQYSYKVDSIKAEFNMLANIKGFADERNGVAVKKDSARKANIINFKIVETGEDYDVLADNQRYQLTFYKALNNKVTFSVEK